MIRLTGLKFFIVASVFFFGFCNFHAIAAEDSGIYTYIFHLWYDNGSLKQDSDFKFPFDLAAKEYKEKNSGEEQKSPVNTIFIFFA